MKLTTRISPVAAATTRKGYTPSSKSATPITSKPQRSDPNIVAVDRTFSERIVGVFGKEGATWLARLPRTLEEIAAQWALNLQSPFETLTYNYVAPATGAEGGEVVLKVGVPNPELHSEMAALRAFAGRGAVKLLKADPDKGALLLERLSPGTSLLEREDDEKATTVACQVMRAMREAEAGDGHFPTVEDWGRGFTRLREHFDGGSGPFSNDMLVRAESLYLVLSASSRERHLLHGDLHHGNILSAQREPWLSIDPKGVIGEAEYEAGAWLRNPLERLQQIENPARLLTRRVDIFVDQLDFDRERVLGWAFAQAVLSAWWSYEDNDKVWTRAIEWAEILEDLA